MFSSLCDSAFFGFRENFKKFLVRIYQEGWDIWIFIGTPFWRAKVSGRKLNEEKRKAGKIGRNLGGVALRFQGFTLLFDLAPFALQRCNFSSVSQPSWFPKSSTINVSTLFASFLFHLISEVFPRVFFLNLSKFSLFHNEILPLVIWYLLLNFSKVYILRAKKYSCIIYGANHNIKRSIISYPKYFLCLWAVTSSFATLQFSIVMKWSSR